MFERLTALLGFRKPPPMPLVAASLSIVPPRVPTSTEAFLRCLARVPHLAPREATVGAFVAWLQELGEAGDWEQAELVEQYKSICELTHVTVMPAKWFGKALECHGCHRWQADVWIDGERWRPMMVHVPHVASKSATDATSPIRNSATQIEGKRVQCARSGSRVASRYGKSHIGENRTHRADIVSAVA